MGLFGTFSLTGIIVGNHFTSHIKALFIRPESVARVLVVK